MSWIFGEYGQVDLGDARRNRRVVTCVQRISAEPAAGFTQSFRDPSELEGYYRLMNNENVTADGLLAPHHSASWKRAVQDDHGSVLVVHDTSEFVYKGEVPRKRLKPKEQASSFFGHFALAVSETSTLPVVHGVIAQGVYRVVEDKWVEGQSEEDEVPLSVGSKRWEDIATRTHAAAPDGMAVIHVMDREADSYRLMEHLQSLGDDFVIRAAHNRLLLNGSTKLFDSFGDSSFEIEREVPLSKRGRKRRPHDRKRHPARTNRKANVIIRGTTVELKRSDNVPRTCRPSMPLSIVEVVERDPPEGEPALHWRILTTLSVETREQVTRIVDIYRKRWLIEEFFKALKTGCSAEKRQGRSLFSLWNTVAILVPIAWRIMGLRVVSRNLKDAPYTEVVDEIELLALREMVPKRMLGRTPTAIDVTLAIARLGGHLKHNGPPGWLTLGRGVEKLDTAGRAWKAALKMSEKSMEFEL